MIDKYKLAKKLVVLYNNRENIKKFRYTEIIGLGMSGYWYYILKNILQKAGAIDEDNNINWDRILELIEQFRKELAV